MGLRSAIPLDDPTLRGGVVEDAESAEVVPGDTTGATIVTRQLRAHFLGDHHRLVHRVSHDLRTGLLEQIANGANCDRP